tara:strand:- start:3372 stop:3956 length:585 start_codon:yes stop_codon:yes gene_type:complete
MSIRNALNKAVEQNTNGDIIDVRKCALDLGCKFGSPFSDATDKGRIDPVENDATSWAVISLNKKNSESENNTVIALLLAKFVLMLEGREIKSERIDVFFLSEMRGFRESPQMLLATRLAIPESVIEKSNDLDFNSHGYAQKSSLMQKFVGSVFFISDARGFFGILNQLEIGYSSRLGSKSLPSHVRESSRQASA